MVTNQRHGPEASSDGHRARAFAQVERRRSGDVNHPKIKALYRVKRLVAGASGRAARYFKLERSGRI